MKDEKGLITTRVIEYHPGDEHHMINCDGCQVIRVCTPHEGKWKCIKCRPYASGGSIGKAGKAMEQFAAIVRKRP